MGLLWDDAAWQEYCTWQKEDKKTIKKINQLIKDAQRNPFAGIGSPEPLKNELSGWWSRHIDEKNRLVYKKDGDNIIIASCKSHYGDK